MCVYIYGEKDDEINHVCIYCNVIEDGSNLKCVRVDHEILVSTWITQMNKDLLRPESDTLVFIAQKQKCLSILFLFK